MYKEILGLESNFRTLRVFAIKIIKFTCMEELIQELIAWYVTMWYILGEQIKERSVWTRAGSEGWVKEVIAEFNLARYETGKRTLNGKGTKYTRVEISY